MSSFYKALTIDGDSKAKALQKAQLALLDNSLDGAVKQLIRGAYPVDQPPPPSNFSHPFYWASFILIGNNR